MAVSVDLHNETRTKSNIAENEECHVMFNTATLVVDEFSTVSYLHHERS